MQETSSLILPPTAPTKHKKFMLYAIADQWYFKNDLDSFLLDKHDSIGRYFPFTYIGITKQAGKRFRDNCLRESRPNQRIAEIIAKNGWTRVDNMFPLYEGDEDVCNNMEYMLRRKADMGLNIKIGGTRKEHRYETPMFIVRNRIEDYLKSKNYVIT